MLAVFTAVGCCRLFLLVVVVTVTMCRGSVAVGAAGRFGFCVVVATPVAGMCVCCVCLGGRLHRRRRGDRSLFAANKPSAIAFLPVSLLRDLCALMRPGTVTAAAPGTVAGSVVSTNHP